MKTNLDQIIDFWENEKRTLEDNIKASIKDWDYINASHYASAILLINQKLTALGRIDPSHRHRINQLEQYIRSIREDQAQGILDFEKVLSGTYDEKARKKFLARLQETTHNKIISIQSQIEKLKSSKPSVHFDNQIIDESILKVIEKEINGFKLYLDQSDNFYFKCTRYSDSLLIIETPRPTEFDPDKWLFWSPLEKLKVIGFKAVHQDQNLVLKLPIATNKNTEAIKIVFARIIFEAYDSTRIKKNMVINLF